MANSRASGVLVKLSHHKATGDTTSFTYSTPQDVGGTYSKIYISFYLVAKASGQTLDLEWNTATSGYTFVHLKQILTTITGTVTAAQAKYNLFPSAEVYINEACVGDISLTSQETTVNQINIMGQVSVPARAQVVLSGYNTETDNTISEIKISMSGTGWLANSVISIYGLKK